MHRLFQAIGPPLVALLVVILIMPAPLYGLRVAPVEDAKIGTQPIAVSPDHTPAIELAGVLTEMTTINAFKTGGPLTGDQAGGLTSVSPENAAVVATKNFPRDATALRLVRTSTAKTMGTREDRSTWLDASTMVLSTHGLGFHLRL